jgi:predicted dehydrogenase
VRTLTATTLSAYITLDYQRQRISVQRRGIEETTSMLDQSGYRTETVTETPYVKRREPLKNELEHFLECVRTRASPRVAGDDGIRAVELADTVVGRM